MMMALSKNTPVAQMRGQSATSVSSINDKMAAITMVTIRERSERMCPQPSGPLLRSAQLILIVGTTLNGWNAKRKINSIKNGVELKCEMLDSRLPMRVKNSFAGFCDRSPFTCDHTSTIHHNKQDWCVLKKTTDFLQCLHYYRLTVDLTHDSYRKQRVHDS